MPAGDQRVAAMSKPDKELREIYRQLQSDLATLFKLIHAHRKPISEGDIRLASVILRKWLTDGLLGRLCNAARIEATVPVMDNSAPLAALLREPSIKYFLTGGVRFNGAPVRGIYNSALPFEGKPLLPVDVMPFRELKVNDFLAQKRLFFEGTLYSCAEIIKFTANKLGGAHFDTRRDPQLEKLDRASQHMKYGGPQPSPNWEPDSEIYMVLEPNSTEVLSGLHIEIIAAAASFIRIKLDGKPIMKLTIKTSLRTRLRRLLRLDKGRFWFFDRSKAR
jgi:hypothetical protein